MDIKKTTEKVNGTVKPTFLRSQEIARDCKRF